MELREKLAEDFGDYCYELKRKSKCTKIVDPTKDCTECCIAYLVETIRQKQSDNKCKEHDWIYILGKDIYRGHVGLFKRVHWCWKCGTVSVSMAQSGYKKKEYTVGNKPKEEEDD